MKNIIKSTISAVLILAFILCLASCAGADDKASGLWKNATYTEDTELGSGAKTFSLEVKVEDKIITFTVHTDKDTVGEALIENGIVSGEEGPYGLYIKVVNGMTADYDVDQSYWAFYIDGEYAMSGVDATEIVEGAKYQLAREK